MENSYDLIDNIIQWVRINENKGFRACEDSQKKNPRLGDMAQELLLCKLEALSSNPSPT
jgi:hypothetical protein